MRKNENIIPNVGISGCILMIVGLLMFGANMIFADGIASSLYKAVTLLSLFGGLGMLSSAIVIGFALDQE